MSITISLNAQSITQTVREKIVDRESAISLQGANVVVIESAPTIDHEMAVTRTRAFTAEETKRYDGLFSDTTRRISSYALDEMTHDSFLDLNKTTLTMTSTLNHKFNAQNNLQTGYLKSDPPTFQKNLFIKDISLKSVAFRRAVIVPVLFTAAGLSTLGDDNDDNYEVQEERNGEKVSPRNEADSVLTRVYFDIANECVFEFNGLNRRVFGTYQSEDGMHITANWHFPETMKSNPFKGSVTRTQNGTVLNGTFAGDSIEAIIIKQP